jgi:hypothetical protein
MDLSISQEYQQFREEVREFHESSQPTMCVEP